MNNLNFNFIDKFILFSYTYINFNKLKIKNYDIIKKDFFKGSGASGLLTHNPLSIQQEIKYLQNLLTSFSFFTI